MNGVVLRWVSFQSDDWRRLVELRRAVLRRPLGLDFTEEQLAAENDQLHLGAWKGEAALGCLVLKPSDEKTIIMRQVAVAPESQGMGIGRLLVLESEAQARRLGKSKITLHARDNVVRFYEQLGYRTASAVFLEVGIAHRTMEKDLCSISPR